MPNPSTNATVQKTSIVPLLSVRNGAKAVEFYKVAFGAHEKFRLEDNGAVFAQLLVDQRELWVSDESPENKNFSPETLGGGTIRLLLVVNDPDAAFERAVKAGATVIHPVSEAYG
jgi:PhnB protein